jgi:tetratricopeptide (TPR) repeat protein
VRTAVVLIALLASAVGLQAVREEYEATGRPAAATENFLYVRSPEFITRAALSYKSLIADIYWIRAVQHYGRTKLSTPGTEQYDLLFPLLDLTTSLDPRFNIAYRFGAIFLAEAYPAGAGRPDEAIALLEKGLRAQPDQWEFAQDIGFIHYWWRRDYVQAAQWFKQAGAMPGAADWLPALAAVTLARGGNRESSRQLWSDVLNSADADWLKQQAAFRLRQLDAMDQIDALARLVDQYGRRAGSRPGAWTDLVRAGYLRGVPIDPERHPYQLNPSTGAVTLDPRSPLNPLPAPDEPPPA